MKRILIVDDEPSILLSLSHLLRSNDAVVITSSRMEEAEEALRRYQFDLVIADIRLSGVEGAEGMELLNYVKRISPATHVIIMTAYGSDDIRDLAYKRGAYHYFEKPIDMQFLADKVQGLGVKVPFSSKRGGAECMS